MDREQNKGFQMIADYEGDISHLFEVHQEGDIAILATRNIVIFPGVISPVLVGRRSSINLVKKMQDNPDALIAIFCQKDPTLDNPSESDLYEMGVYAKIIRVLEMPVPGGQLTAIVQGLGKCLLHKVKRYRPFLIGTTTPIDEELPSSDDKEFNAAVAE